MGEVPWPRGPTWTRPMAEAPRSEHGRRTALKRRVLFVHGGGEGAHEADEKLAARLRDALGGGYHVRSPKMPNEGSPEVEAWNDRISEELAATDGEVVLVGHSVGAFVL